MVGFKATILKFDRQGEKTGWTYIPIPGKIAAELKPGFKKSFRVKGKIDQHKIKAVALLPMGDGNFILALNAALRNAIKKNKGADVMVEIEEDTAAVKLSPVLLTCLEDDPAAKAYFKKLSPSHQHYYSKWIDSAKTDATKTKRIALAINAFSNKLSYAQMIQMQRKDF